jgi:trimeric autotransporter adhesin
VTRISSTSLLLLLAIAAQPSGAAQPDRIPGRLDPTRVIPIKGNIHPKARPEDDRGRVSPNLKLDYVTLHLKPTPAQQAELDQLLTEQQDSHSSNFRKWLTPEQYADRFGASPADIAQIVAWLESRGLAIVNTARGRNFVVFKGTAGMVEAALHTELHNFLVDGEMHYANATEPSVPAAILPFTI